ncbi:hypothetical protein [Nitrosomonas sp. Nm166]|uniref:AbrB/MazE/SpoVT family DNA-binding domain-containing protein n=1 Tax=Nitrosomonas sp. Nm166 TaxID=1881054 RepID=UPI0008F21E25|nr:hypothetical protein [Nitrosomonas sp. Nm166]SFE35384.1 hypothetical protein SAMN05428977_101343 [Nitrosomonas sp. Nm166]
MRAKVTKQGVLIPKQWLEGINVVEIRQERTRIVIEPADMVDPILQLGTEPIVADVDDASIHHDHYLTSQ